ncbi:hypothetical protein [Halogranum amylolyticum]|uniref:hypothetical protein n=1 Tax=Halogranum amylolyticum TaxID=660520 RepID=UPI001114E590|nr:hypothetical protein [Halogranum amylolyticum]
MSTADEPGFDGPWSFSRPSPIAILGVIVTSVVWLWFGGPLGLGLAGLLVLGVFALSPPFAFGFGQVLLVGAFSEEVAVGILLAESGLLLILLSEYSRRPHSRRLQLATITAFAVVGGIGLTAVVLEVDLWILAVASLLVASTIAYVLHRLERVRLDLINEE